MKRAFQIIIMLSVYWMPQLLAQPFTRDTIAERKIEDELRSINPKLVHIFQRATQALDNNDNILADSLYTIVCAKAPIFDPALRRLGGIRILLGKTEEGIALCEKAVSVNRSAYNLLALSHALGISRENIPRTQEQMTNALKLLKEARDLPNGSESDFLIMTAQIAIQLQSSYDLRSATNELMVRFPDLMLTHYYNAILAAVDEKWSMAEEEIHIAESMGLPHEVVQSFLDSGVHTRVLIWRYALYSMIVIAVWAFGLLALYGFGKLLSNFTLHSITTSDPNISLSGLEMFLRRIYRMLINIAGMYYYISLPIVIFIIIMIVVMLFYFFYMLGRIPINIMAILSIGAAVTIYKMIQSLFKKIKIEDPGRALTLEEAPGLWKLTSEVANSLDTRPIGEIRITPGTDMAVYERGSWKKKMNDKADRILILGIANLNGMKQNDFQAILAHEYGHFAHRDTAGGDIALRVKGDMDKFLISLYQAGEATYWNAALHFLRLFNIIFRKISHGATRLQEVLADRIAVQKYGLQAFRNGLLHIIRSDIEFHSKANKEIEKSQQSGNTLQNLYELLNNADDNIDKEMDKIINRVTSEQDTHPSPKDRFQFIKDIQSSSISTCSGLIWDLFTDKKAITREMTELVASRNLLST
jgi:hypothetical protein